jgi:hypothetical protein
VGMKDGLRPVEYVKRICEVKEEKEETLVKK